MYVEQRFKQSTRPRMGPSGMPLNIDLPNDRTIFTLMDIIVREVGYNSCVQRTVLAKKNDRRCSAVVSTEEKLKTCRH
jgi:hypothetical protein